MELSADEACMTQAQDTDLEREHHTYFITHFFKRNCSH